MPEALHILIETLAAMTAADQPLTPAELPLLGRVARRIVSLALICDQGRLAQAGMKLCDLIAFARGGVPQRAALRAHVRALRLLAPRLEARESRIGVLSDDPGPVPFVPGAIPPAGNGPR